MGGRVGRGFWAIVVLLASSALPLVAHHSDSDVDGSVVVTIEGELLEVMFVNPHVLLFVATPKAGSYRVVWAEPRRLIRLGVAKGTLHVGDRIAVVASPSRDPRDHTLSLVREVRRASDGWRWSRGSTVID